MLLLNSERAVCFGFLHDLTMIMSFIWNPEVKSVARTGRLRQDRVSERSRRGPTREGIWVLRVMDD
jgi:hypothetical protein